MKRRRCLVLLASVMIAACATTLSTKGARIELISQERVTDGCTFLGAVTGSSKVTGIGRHIGFNNAVNEMLEDAADIGATQVVLDPTSEANYWTTNELARGKAYRCPAGYPSVQTSPSGCGKDTDCKGDRVCREGKCVDPGQE